jgi:hypothetical protein
LAISRTESLIIEAAPLFGYERQEITRDAALRRRWPGGGEEQGEE